MSDIEAALRALGARLEQEPASDPTAVIIARLDAPAPRRRRWAVLVLALVALLALTATALAASSGLRDDVRRWLAGAGVQVETVPTVTARRAASLDALGIGAPADPTTAARRLGLTSLPAPFGSADAVRISTTAGGEPVVTLVWNARPGLPARRGSDLAALLTIARPVDENDPYLIGKLLPVGSTADFVALSADGSSSGVFISGVPHAVTLLDGRTERFRLAENVLLWRSKTLVYRLESGLGRDASVAAAEAG